VPYETIQSRERERPHPATFPVALAERCLRLHGVVGDSVPSALENPATTRHRKLTVLDPFLGIGNSALAAKNCGATQFIGFEIDAEYLAIARERLGLCAPESENKTAQKKAKFLKANKPARTTKKT
jgi:site-specific DNA-methyltransferase (adenine-specific)